MADETKRILLAVHHNAFREALAMRLEQEEDLEVAWQAGSITDTRDVHLDGVDVAVVDPVLPDPLLARTPTQQEAAVRASAGAAHRGDRAAQAAPAWSRAFAPRCRKS